MKEIHFPVTYTYGELPTKEVFEQAWALCEMGGGLRDGLFHFGNDPYVGNDALTCEELWATVNEVFNQYADQLQETPNSLAQDPEKAGNWLSSLLSIFDIEWV